ncbi:N-acetyllactosaminide beta-1,3-N-acetylglucosaminyltransferase 3 [Microcaecilia unicolor]|uniref:Hexosyltransferase n=1 Tax=Microcaecilia unicolor TaxID=1415580 RepID=A0A6P7ZFR7_9AMPH|nr:N-acetyllactosaminide beta-1,3-N-acetylglucosaminyltransferase 3 [Microcaecilia unicolor]XP_030074429.1 N-acetyllactosaminide beta-1,3-N-acetylglucosaminyltransferase 3 [Microcaecilia unicolor]
MRCKRSGLEIFTLTAVGFLGLIFLLNENDRDPTLIPRQETAEEDRVSHVLPTVPPTRDHKPVLNCRENSAVVNVSGFAQLPDHIKDFLRYRHCKEFPRILDVPNKCGGAQASKNVFLLLAIKSSPGNYERREIIRKTWGVEKVYQGVQVRRLFLTGVSSNLWEAKKTNRLLRLERREHMDILQWDFYDTFFNLTLKQVLFHQWMEEMCPGVRFIFNGDDDVFVNTYNVVQYLVGLPSTNNSHLYVGQLIFNVGPIRETWSKYYVPEQITKSNSYPPYCGGGGILMSGFTFHAIYQASLDIELFPIDDVYLGMCLDKAGLAPASHMGMSTVGVSIPSSKLEAFDPCYYKELLMVHRFIPYEMLVMWQALQEPNLVCGQMNKVYVGM